MDYTYLSYFHKVTISVEYLFHTPYLNVIALLVANSCIFQCDKVMLLVFYIKMAISIPQ